VFTPAQSAVVTSAAAVRALTTSHGATYLQPFVHQESTVAQAAESMGESIQKVHYWVLRLVELKLLRRVGTTKRAGRAIQRYRAAATAYVFPAVAMPPETFERTAAERAGVLHQALRRAFPQLTDADLVLTFGETGQITLNRVFGEGGDMLAGHAPAVLYTWRSLALTGSDAKNLQRELWELVGRYRERQVPNADPTHLVHVAMAPTL
jgi:hypothetical protein